MPAVRPEQPDKSLCNALGCSNPGTKFCTGCKEAVPRTRYCSERCQGWDWQFHKKFCKKKAYTFDIELLGSKDPVIKRTVDVPAWYTFQQLHFVLQYAFGPWQQCHLHEFNFTTSPPNRSGMFSFDMPKQVLRIIAEGEDQEERAGPQVRTIKEKQVKLSDVYGTNGRYHGLVWKDEEFVPLVYLYDFGDNWEHLIKFRKEKCARADRPLFSRAIGYAPPEDAGGVTGWEEVKAAFAASSPSRAQLEKRRWAVERMGMEGRNDPLAVGDSPYSPFNEPNVTVMNYGGRWENHYRGFREQLGETVTDDEFGDEDEDDEEDFAF